jgi:epsilon-lactone hydrolase
LRVISVNYTTAPFAKWRQITGEVTTVFKALLADGIQMKDIAFYGDSAGGSLAAGVTLKMRDEGLGMPAALVLWSPWTDITETGDTYATLAHADPSLIYTPSLKNSADAYADPAEQLHPYVSPVYGDFSKGFSPTLIQVGTKEIFLSNAIRLYHAIEAKGGTAKLDVYEGMPHVFQQRLPESAESVLALRKVKHFLDQFLGE